MDKNMTAKTLSIATESGNERSLAIIVLLKQMHWEILVHYFI